MKRSTSPLPGIFRTLAVAAGGLALAVSLHAQVAPTITAISAPRQVVNLGQSLTLSVTATGATTYQWKRNGRPIAGATNSTYTITNATTWRDNGWYQAVAANASGSATSATVFVNVAVSPAHVYAWGYNSSGQTTVPVGLSNVTGVATGNSHTVALKADGTVVVWGYNGYGQATVPGGLNNVVGVAAGDFHTVALKADGTVVAWGDNGWGQTTVPAGLGNVVCVAAGGNHTVALLTNGTLAAWGTNSRGQTVVPSGLSNVVGMAAGSDHTVALKADGTVVAWGNNHYGQATVPAGLSNVVGVATGVYHTVALKADGTVVTWGDNVPGQTTVPSGLSNVAGVAAGGYHTVALLTDGTVAAWGTNGSGQATVPVGLGNVVGVAAGSYFSVVTRDSRSDTAPTITTQPAAKAANLGGRVTLSVTASFGTAPTFYQWRKGGTSITGATSVSLTIDAITTGDAGNFDVVVSNYRGTTTSNAAALTVNAAPVVSATGNGRYLVAPGQNLTLTLASSISGSATVQWKRNGMPVSGATGRSFEITNASRSSAGCYQAVYNEGSGAVTSAPIFVLYAPTTTQLVGWGGSSGDLTHLPATSLRVIAAASYSYRNAALLADGTVVNWGGYSPPVGLSNVVAVAAGSDHFLALKADGTVVQWGNTNTGQANSPVGLSGVVAIAAGSYHSLALKSDGTVVAWGSANYGGTAVPAGLVNVIGLAAGYEFSLALKADGTVVGWGYNGSGQSSVPSSIGSIVSIVAASNYSLALKDDGTVVTWGANGMVPPVSLSGAVAIVAGYSHALALKADGSVVAWGSNDFGQTTLPTGLNSIIGLAGGFAHSLALRDATGDLAPVITAQPAGKAAFTGQDVTLSVTAAGGTALFNYQWRKNGVPITGATNTVLSLLRIAAADAGSFDVIVSNWLGTATSSTATVTVSTTPAVALNLTGRQVVNPGQALTLTATAAIPGPVTYQWQRDGRTIAGATNASYVIASAMWRDAGVYRVIATNMVGPAVSAAVFLWINSPTQIIAFGNNSSGQITVPQGLTNTVAVAAGESHSLALLLDGTVVAWGANDSGQTNVPSGISNIVAIAAGGNTSMALRSDGNVMTWGALNYTPSGVADATALARIHHTFLFATGFFGRFFKNAMPRRRSAISEGLFGPFPL